MAILAMLTVGILVLAVVAVISWLVLEIIMFALSRALADVQNNGAQISNPLTLSADRANEEMATEFSF